MKVLVDADQLCYACGFAAAGEPVSHSLQLAKKALHKIQQETGVEELELYIKGKGNFREGVAITQGYKTNRSAPPPDTYEDIRDYLKSQWGAEEVNGMEADDIVSILLWSDYVACDGDRSKATIIVSSPDKDLKNTPGWHHYPRTGEVKWVTPFQATQHFYYQMLEGDNVDNIKGLPYVAMSDVQTFSLNKQANSRGCGKASAKKLMLAEEAMADPEQFVWDRYMAWGQEECLTAEEVREYFVEQAQLLWMTRELDCFGQPVLYQPNEEAYERAAERYYGEGGFSYFSEGSKGGAAEDGDGLFDQGAAGDGQVSTGGGDDQWDAFLGDDLDSGESDADRDEPR